MCVSGLCQWAGWTFSFLGFWSGCTLTGPSAQHPPGRGWRGRVFGSALAAPEGRGGGRRVGYSPDAWPAAHAGPRPRPPSRPPSPEAPPHRCCSTACARADWLWRGPISARLPRPLGASLCPALLGPRARPPPPPPPPTTRRARNGVPPPPRPRATGDGPGGSLRVASASILTPPTPGQKGL